MKTVWIIEWTNGKNNTIDVYDEYTFAEKTYRRRIESAIALDFDYYFKHFVVKRGAFCI